MYFKVVPNDASVPTQGEDVCFLWADNWDDWFKYKTLYSVTYFDENGKRHDIGGVKIGRFGMKGEKARPGIPSKFERLGPKFFSLGQDVSYYSALRNLGDGFASAFVTAMNDVVADQQLFQRALDEDVMGVSLLRFVTVQSVKGQFRRTYDGGAELTGYSFRYQGPHSEDTEEDCVDLSFDVNPESTPPTNIHVLIGRNGVGKTYILERMTRALVENDEDRENNGYFSSLDDFDDVTREIPFANIVSVGFSAFDEFLLIRQPRNVTRGRSRYIHVGLRKRVKDRRDEWMTITQDPSDLAEEFSASAKVCVVGEKLVRWKRALLTLETDSLFSEAEVASLVNLDEEGFGRRAKRMYRRLSSGHKIVLLTITKLVETVEEKTLVLMDEPEAHLHPPLLSAFIRALSDLLINRNGVAVVATHSPVILQEVPSSCVWKVVRHGSASKAERLELQTFAENVGVLTREVFGFEVTRSGFNKMLATAVAQHATMDDVLSAFDNEVGSEGRALISSKLATKAADGETN